MSLLGDLTPVEIELLLDAVDSSPYSSDADERGPTDDTAPRQSQQQQRVQRRGDSAAYRLRKREELGRLRHEAETLQLQLEQLQHERHDRRLDHSTVLTRVSVWRRMAIHQQKARKRAELDNAGLKKTLEKQCKLAQQLQRALETQASRQNAAILKYCGVSLVPIASGHVLQDWISDANWSHVDAAFAEAKLLDLNSDFEDTRVCLGDAANSTAFVQVRNVRVFPFDSATLNRALLQPLTAMPIDRANYELKAWSDNLIVVQSETPTFVGRVEVVLCAELTVRRKHESSRSIHVFTVVYTVRSTCEAYDGIQLLGEGWYTVQNFDSCGERSGASVVRCLERTTLRGSQQHDLTLLSTIVSEQYGAHFDRVENALMDVAAERIVP